jgi:hypothetical protein
MMAPGQNDQGLNRLFQKQRQHEQTAGTGS